MQKRIVHRQPPDGGALREAMKAANNHLDYIDYLIDHRTWLAGATMSLADLAAAAHISVADYLGGIDWTGHDQTKRSSERRGGKECVSSGRPRGSPDHKKK